MVSSGSNFLGLYGQSPRHAAALYTDARDSMRQASTSASRRRSMQPTYAASPVSYDYTYEEPHRTSASEATNTPPPPYSCRASVLPETLPPAALPAPPEPRPSPTPSSNSLAPTSRSQKRRSALMIKDFGMRLLSAK